MVFIYLTIVFTIILILRKYGRKRLPIGNKTVFITGCDSGIGLVASTKLKEEGFRVFSTCLSLDSNGAKKLMNNGIQVIEMDVTKAESVENALRFVEENTPDGLWAIINNAGVCIFGEFDWFTWGHCEFQNSVNLMGTMRVTKAFLKLLKQTSGRVITITSVNGLVSYPGTSVYSATKFGLEGFCDSLRNELHKFDVKVITIAPGDFAKLTNIMAKHELHANEMWEEMSAENRDIYKDYFKSYQDSAKVKIGYSSPPAFESTSIIQDIEDALLLKDPFLKVTSASLGVKIFVFIIKYLPVHLSDKFLRLVFSLVFKVEYNGSINKKSL